MVAVQHDAGTDGGEMRRGVLENRGTVGGMDQRRPQPRGPALRHNGAESLELHMREGRLLIVRIGQMGHEPFHPQGPSERR